MMSISPYASTLLLLLAGHWIAPTSAADCGASGVCPWTNGATRDNMYAARSEVCGTDRYRTAGTYRIPSRSGYLRWGAGDQQTCWDAFDNIINQCKLGNNGIHPHAGQYEYNGVYYNAVDCE